MKTNFVAQRVAITVGEAVHIMSLVEQAPYQALPFSAAEAAGFILTVRDEFSDAVWVREITDAVIEDEISRTPSVAVNSGWRRIKEGDIPKDRTRRNRLVDDGKKLGHRKG